MMKNRGCILIMVILFPTMYAFGQNAKQFKNEIGFSIFTLENNGFTENPELVPKFAFGPYYNRFFSNLSWISHIEFGKNVIEEDATDILDGFYGKGEMTEFTISSGIRNTFLRQRTIFVKPFLESDFFYSNVSYKAELDGGFFGQGKIIDNTNNIYGFLFRIGLVIYPISRISITVSSSVKFGRGTRIDHHQDTKEDISFASLSLLQIRFGYQFGK